MNRTRLLLCALLPAGLSACDLSPVMCTTAPQPGIVVTIRDAATGAPAAGGAMVTARDGDSIHQLETWGENPLTAEGAGRPGTYTVTVDKPGYLQWRKNRVRVTRGECHPRTVHLEANLTPTP